jgi:hypothetical protein
MVPCMGHKGRSSVFRTCDESKPGGMVQDTFQSKDVLEHKDPCNDGRIAYLSCRCDLGVTIERLCQECDLVLALEEKIFSYSHCSSKSKACRSNPKVPRKVRDKSKWMDLCDMA